MGTLSKGKYYNLYGFKFERQSMPTPSFPHPPKELLLARRLGKRQYRKQRKNR